MFNCYFALPEGLYRIYSVRGDCSETLHGPLKLGMVRLYSRNQQGQATYPVKKKKSYSCCLHI